MPHALKRAGARPRPGPKSRGTASAGPFAGARERGGEGGRRLPRRPPIRARLPRVDAESRPTPGGAAARADLSTAKSGEPPPCVSPQAEQNHQTPLAGMPLRSTGRGAVSPFHVDSAFDTGPAGARATNSPCPSAGFSAPSSTITRPRDST